MDIKKIIILASVIIITSCTKEKTQSNPMNNNTSKEPFYAEKGGFDYIRFPLTKPYEVLSLDKGKKWNIKPNYTPKDLRNAASIFGIKKINYLNNKIIIAYCEDDGIVGGQLYPKSWFIIIPEKEITKGFTTEKDFIDYLKEQGVAEKEIQWNSPEDLFKQFSDTYCLPWIPGC